MATEVNLPVSPDEICADATHERYVFRDTKELLNILPALADRPVVTRPATPFYLPRGEEITIFVSSLSKLRKRAVSRKTKNPKNKPVTSK